MLPQREPFDIRNDFTGLKLGEDEKAELKKAMAEDGTEFDTTLPGTYKCMYQVTPAEGESYLVARNIFVVPRESETQSDGQDGNTGKDRESSGEDEESSETEWLAEEEAEAEQISEAEAETERIVEAETETERISEVETERQNG